MPCALGVKAVLPKAAKASDNKAAAEHSETELGDSSCNESLQISSSSGSDDCGMVDAALQKGGHRNYRGENDLTLNGHHYTRLYSVNRWTGVKSLSGYCIWCSARHLDTERPHLECKKDLHMGSDLSEGHCGIANHYRFSVEQGERVAGRQAVRVRIRPLDMYRFGYVMELDRETGLLLKTETLGRGDKILEKFQFASLSYSGAGHDVQDVELVHQAQHPHPDMTANSAPGLSRAWAIKWLPRGFVATDQPMIGVSRRTFTDGLAVFSVFLEELGGDIRPGEGVARYGGTVSYTRGIQLTGQPVLVTVIGEVPLNTARMVADSIVWAP